MNKTKRLLALLSLMLIVTVSFSQNADSWKNLGKTVNFYLANDLGRNGYYDQKPIAELMGQMAETVESGCRLSCSVYCLCTVVA